MTKEAQKCQLLNKLEEMHLKYKALTKWLEVNVSRMFEACYNEKINERNILYVDIKQMYKKIDNVSSGKSELGDEIKSFLFKSL